MVTAEVVVNVCVGYSSAGAGFLSLLDFVGSLVVCDGSSLSERDGGGGPWAHTTVVLGTSPHLTAVAWFDHSLFLSVPWLTMQDPQRPCSAVPGHSQRVINIC